MRYMAFQRLIKQALTRGTRSSTLLGPLLAVSLALTLAPADDQDDRETIKLKAIGSFASGIFNAVGAEIVAHDPKTQRLFVVNALSATVDVLSESRGCYPRGANRRHVPWRRSQQRGGRQRHRRGGG
jgi:hypothetical protein